MSKTSDYYKSNPEAREKRLEYQRRYNRQRRERLRRSFLNKENRKRGTYGNGDGLDVSHRSDGSTFLEDEGTNRARNRGKA